MPPVGFEPTVSVGERPQTYVLDRVATLTGFVPNFTLPYILPAVFRSVIFVLTHSCLTFVTSS